jgi:transposase
MQIFLDEISNRYPNDRMVMVLDGAGWRKSKTLKIPQNMKLLPLPPYSPELNPVENAWEELREKHFHNRVFSSLDDMEEQAEKEAPGDVKVEKDHGRVETRRVAPLG